MMRRGTLDLLPMVTDRMPLEAAPAVLGREGGLGAGKVLVLFDRKEGAA